MTEALHNPLSILVIEDDPGDFGLVKDCLRQAGFSIGFGGNASGPAWAQTLRAGITAAQQSAPDVILLDLSLPDSSGIITLRTLRAALHNTPIVVLTGNDEKAMALAALESGAQDYLCLLYTSGKSPFGGLVVLAVRGRKDRR